MSYTDGSKRLSGKIGLVSGGPRMIEAAIAEILAASGAAVMVTDVLDDLGRAVVERIRGSGGQASFHPLDVTDEAQWEKAVSATIAAFGGLDFVINNAGVELIDLVVDTDFEQWCRLQDVNSDGVFLGTKHAIR